MPPYRVVGGVTVSEAASMAGMAKMPWSCWIEIDLDAIAHNVEAIREVVGPSCSVAAVVKAQAYGHGAVVVARTALEAGASWLIVARVREGVQLRRAGITAPILVLGPTEAGETFEAVQNDLRPTVANAQAAQQFAQAALAAHKDVPVHVKVDTGLSRFGIRLEEAIHLVREVNSLPSIYLEGLYSHFATADEPDLAFARRQIAAFREGVDALRGAGATPSTVHMAASAATLALGESHFDMIRLGISLYGVYPSQHLRDRVNLRPALSMFSRVARVFDLRRGDSVGYGRTFVADRPMRAGLVPLGYADGLPRSHSNRGELLVNGRRAPLLGRISMDQCVVDLSNCGAVSEGAEAVVIGAQGSESIGIDDFAALSGTISYEALTSLGIRVPRLYRRMGSPAEVAYLDEGIVVAF